MGVSSVAAVAGEKEEEEEGGWGTITLQVKGGVLGRVPLYTLSNLPTIHLCYFPSLS